MYEKTADCLGGPVTPSAPYARCSAYLTPRRAPALRMFLIFAAGTLWMFDRKAVRFFRKDGHNWARKKDGKTVRETHEKLKVRVCASALPPPRRADGADKRKPSPAIALRRWAQWSCSTATTRTARRTTTSSAAATGSSAGKRRGAQLQASCVSGASKHRRCPRRERTAGHGAGALSPRGADPAGARPRGSSRQRRRGHLRAL